jgi:hypothetical protein
MTTKPPYRPPIPPTLADCAWRGWLRAGAYPWRAVCGGATYSETWDRLLDLYGGQSCDRLVLEKDKRP